MEFSGGITASLAGRYAAALFNLAKERDLSDAVEGDLANLSQAIRESDDLAGLIRLSCNAARWPLCAPPTTGRSAFFWLPHLPSTSQRCRQVPVIR